MKLREGRNPAPPFPGPDHCQDAGRYSPAPAASGPDSFEAPPSSFLPPWRRQLVADRRNVLDRSCGFGADQPETPHDRLQASIGIRGMTATVVDAQGLPIRLGPTDG